MKNDIETKIPSLQIGPDKFNPQTPTPNPQGTGTLNTVTQSSFYYPDGKPVNLPVVYYQFFEALYRRDIFDLVASVANVATMESGVAIYYIGQRAITRDYSQGTKLPSVASFREEYITLDYSKEVSYTYESLDLKQMGVELKANGYSISSAFVGSINDRVAKSEMVYHQMKLLQGIVNSAKKNIKLTLIEPGQWVKSGNDYNWVPDTSVDSWRALWYQFTTFIELAKSTITEEYFGLELDQFSFIAGARAKVMLNMFPINYGAKSTEIITNLNVDSVSGIKFKTVPYLGNLVAGVSLIDANEAFDLTGIDAILIHKEAYAYPIYYGQASVTIDPTNLNPRVFRKFRVSQTGGKAIRPDLIYGIVFKRPDKPKP